MNKKEECPICKRKLRIRCFLFNKVRKERICRQCDKRIGSNKFYVPFAKKKDYIGNYSLTEQEKFKLYQKFTAEGNDSRTAWKKVYHHVNLLKQQKQKSMYSDKQRKRYFAQQAEQRKEYQKKFVEGLK